MAIYSLRLTAVGKTTQKQPFTAAAHLKYITRKGAVTHVMGERMPTVRRQAVAWLKAEERTDRKNARVIDKAVLALPRELSRAAQHALVRFFAETLTQGRASWFAAFHTEGKDRHNPHCHLILRDRDFETGRRVMFLSAGAKEASQRRAKGQSIPTNLEAIRELWERCANAALQATGRTERIDRRSLKRQGVARRPQVHEGPNIRAMHARGVRPASKVRVVRYRQGAQFASRLVRYIDIDNGRTRAEYNDAIRAGAVMGQASGRSLTLQHRVVAGAPPVDRTSIVHRATMTTAMPPVASTPSLTLLALPTPNPQPDHPQGGASLTMLAKVALSGASKSPPPKPSLTQQLGAGSDPLVGEAAPSRPPPGDRSRGR